MDPVGKVPSSQEPQFLGQAGREEEMGPKRHQFVGALDS
jgi:hypothetical protein